MQQCRTGSAAIAPAPSQWISFAGRFGRRPRDGGWTRLKVGSVPQQVRLRSGHQSRTRITSDLKPDGSSQCRNRLFAVQWHGC
jgi:hypothetical protein